MAVSLSQKHEFNEWTEFGPVVFEHLSDTPDVGRFQARFVYFLLFRLGPVRVLSLVARQNEHGKNYIRLVERECLFLGKHTRPAVETTKLVTQVNHESFRHS